MVRRLQADDRRLDQTDDFPDPMAEERGRPDGVTGARPASQRAIFARLARETASVGPGSDPIGLAPASASTRGVCGPSIGAACDSRTQSRAFPDVRAAVGRPQAPRSAISALSHPVLRAPRISRVRSRPSVRSGPSQLIFQLSQPGFDLESYAFRSRMTAEPRRMAPGPDQTTLELTVTSVGR